MAKKSGQAAGIQTLGVGPQMGQMGGIQTPGRHAVPSRWTERQETRRAGEGTRAVRRSAKGVQEHGSRSR